MIMAHDRSGGGAPATRGRQRVDQRAAIAQAASRDAAGVPAALLGDYLTLLTEAAASRHRLDRAALDAVGDLGRQAAQQGVPVGRAVDLYVSATRRLWRLLPVVDEATDAEQVRQAGETVLRVVNEAVAALADGYLAARREMVRREETLRRELIDDLLRGDRNVAGIVERAEPFGLNLTRAHQVALAEPGRRLVESAEVINALERAVLDRFGDRDVLVAAKDGMLAVLVPGTTGHASSPGRRSGPATAPAAAGPQRPADELGPVVHAAVAHHRAGRPWRVAVGRPYPGAFGIARSYEEAREALDLAGRLDLPEPVTRAEDLLVYRVLLRDQAAVGDLIDSVLTPLTTARGGAEPLLTTLEAYFAHGGVATYAARQLHLSVRAVTYRLSRVHTLTGYDPTEPGDWFTLRTAVLGARLLGWPGRDLPR
jgi:sugar diacid utilization regulator